MHKKGVSSHEDRTRKDVEDREGVGRMKTYFVSFGMSKADEKLYIGNTEIKRDGKIATYEDTLEVSREIESKLFLIKGVIYKVAIISWTVIR